MSSGTFAWPSCATEDAGITGPQERGAQSINVSSQMGHVGSPNRTVLLPQQHALEGLTKAMALELVAHRIR